MKTNFKILMTLMGMEIGGAETHVLELCKALKKRGVTVFVASNGGVYVEELERFGITHFEVPLHNKNPMNLFKSYEMLKKIIIDNDIKLVNSHARIPSFICGMLKKKLGFRFVTTCHGAYSTELPFKVLTNWGEKTLAVSEDIESYLSDNYEVKRENLFLTVNGIDTEKFSAQVLFDDFLEEFNLNKNNRRIVYVSRLDKEVTGSCHSLLNIARKIYDYDKNINIIIVGAGTDFNEIKKEVDVINGETQSDFITLTGGRTDINKIVASSSLFVGLSRAGLEALATEKPLILAGTPGYIGIFDESKLEVSVQTNFTCRGLKPIDDEEMLRDIKKLLESSESELKQLGEYGRKIILENYSTEKMADDALNVYSNVLKSERTLDALILGYYGSNNHGDDMLLKAITEDLREIYPEINMTVLSKRPKDTSAEYKVDAVFRINIFKIFKLLKNTNLLISGGGTLIQDLTSTQSLLYYLFIIRNAKKRGAKVMLYANGMGPVGRSSFNREFAKNVLDEVDLITLRDKDSRVVLEELGVTKTPIAITADPAFGIKIREMNASLKKLEKLEMSNVKYFCVAIRNWKLLKDGFEKDIALFCDYVKEKYNLTPIFIPMQPINDEEISRKVIGMMKGKGVYLGNDFSCDEILGVVARAEFVLAMRLHAIIYSAKSGTPIIGLVYDPKVKAMMELLEQVNFCDVDKFELESLKKFVDNVMENHESIKINLIEKNKEFEEKAFKNAEMAMELINNDF